MSSKSNSSKKKRQVDKYQKYKDEMFDLLDRYHRERMKEKLGGKCFVVFSVHDEDAKGVYINIIDDIAIRGTVVLNRWGYTSQPIKNPTWMEIAVFANKAIVNLGDWDHVYLEGVRRDKDDKRMYHLEMGS